MAVAVVVYPLEPLTDTTYGTCVPATIGSHHFLFAAFDFRDYIKTPMNRRLESPALSAVLYWPNIIHSSQLNIEWCWDSFLQSS